MAKKKKGKVRGKRSSPQKKSPKKKGNKSYSKHSAVYALVRQPPLQRAFPTSIRTKVQTFVSLTQASTIAPVSFTFLANSFGVGSAAGQPAGCGPSINYSGNFAANFPAGNAMWLQNPITAGNTQPYSKYRILGSTCYWRLVPTGIPGSTIASTFMEGIGFPTTQIDFTGMTLTTFAEQPDAKYQYISYPVYGGNSNVCQTLTGGGAMIGAYTPAWRKSRFDVAKMFGIDRKTIDINTNFWGSSNSSTSPGSTGYHQIVVTGDNSGNYAFVIQFKIVYDVIYFDLNQLTSVRNT